MRPNRVSVILLVAVLAAGCTSGDDADRPSTATTAERTSMTAEAAAEDDVLAAYRAFWNAYLAAGDPMNPAHPGLPLVATGDELDRVRETFSGYFAEGFVIRGSLDLSPELESLESGRAEVRDCYRDRTHLFDADTGEQQDPPDEPRFEVIATLELDDGTWKVARMESLSEGCAP